MTTETIPQLTVTDLATEFDMDPRTVRRLIRAQDFRAPRGEDTANRYSWDPDSPDLATIRKALHTYKNPPAEPEAKHTPVDAPVDDRPKAKRASTRKAKAAKSKEKVAELEPAMDLDKEDEELELAEDDA